MATAGNVAIPFNAANFTSPRDNSYYPMAKGLTYVYRAEEEEGLVVDEITQTEETKDILGVEELKGKTVKVELVDVY